MTNSPACNVCRSCRPRVKFCLPAWTMSGELSLQSPAGFALSPWGVFVSWRLLRLFRLSPFAYAKSWGIVWVMRWPNNLRLAHAPWGVPAGFFRRERHSAGLRG